jgi:hypothetical protein
MMLVVCAGSFCQEKNQPPVTPPDRVQQLQMDRKLEKKPDNGYIPDVQTAVRVAEAVLVPVYGARQVAHERPFRASLAGDLWTVSGSMHHCRTTTNKVCVGGVAVVQISKASGEVLLLVHEE